MTLQLRIAHHDRSAEMLLLFNNTDRNNPAADMNYREMRDELATTSPDVPEPENAEEGR